MAELWNSFWITLSQQQPALFHRELVPSIFDTQALAYLYVRKQYPQFVPPLRLDQAELASLQTARTRLALWTGLTALERPAQFRLVRRGCPVLEAEARRETTSEFRAAMTFPWAASVRRVALIYEHFVDHCREKEMSFLLIGIMLHEEIHSAHNIAAGRPTFEDDKSSGNALEELATTLLGHVAELLVIKDGVPTRAELLRWNRLSANGQPLNRLMAILPGEIPELVAGVSHLAVAALRAAGETEVLELLSQRSPRRRSSGYWRQFVAE